MKVQILKRLRSRLQVDQGREAYAKKLYEQVSKDEVVSSSNMARKIYYDCASERVNVWLEAIDEVLLAKKEDL